MNNPTFTEMLNVWERAAAEHATHIHAIRAGALTMGLRYAPLMNEDDKFCGTFATQSDPSDYLETKNLYAVILCIACISKRNTKLGKPSTIEQIPSLHVAMSYFMKSYSFPAPQVREFVAWLYLKNLKTIRPT